MMLIKTIRAKYKLRKARTLSGYIDYVEKTDLSEIPELTVCIDKAFDVSEFKTTSIENMFVNLDLFDNIRQKYSLGNIADGGNDFDNVIKLMKWLTENTYYSGAQYKFLPDDTLKILDFSFQNGFNHAINCRYKAIALSDILVSAGIKAFPVCLVDSNFNGCHLMCEVYLREQNKWIVVDPSFNTYFTDENDRILDVFELRELFLEMKTPKIIGYNFNGTAKCKNIYINVFVKSCLANISTWQDNSGNCRDSQNMNNSKKFIYKVPSLQKL